jgi:hypothetical protein
VTPDVVLVVHDKATVCCAIAGVANSVRLNNANRNIAVATVFRIFIFFSLKACTGEAAQKEGASRRLFKLSQPFQAGKVSDAPTALSIANKEERLVGAQPAVPGEDAWQREAYSKGCPGGCGIPPIANICQWRAWLAAADYVPTKNVEPAERRARDCALNPLLRSFTAGAC